MPQESDSRAPGNSVSSLYESAENQKGEAGEMAARPRANKSDRVLARGSDARPRSRRKIRLKSCQCCRRRRERSGPCGTISCPYRTTNSSNQPLLLRVRTRAQITVPAAFSDQRLAHLLCVQVHSQEMRHRRPLRPSHFLQPQLTLTPEYEKPLWTYSRCSGCWKNRAGSLYPTTRTTR